MESGTSIVPSRTGPINLSLSTAAAGAASPPLLPTTVLSGLPQRAIITAAPTTSCSTPNIVIVELSTTLTIPDYHRFYDTPIQSFHPSYYPLTDGSLVAPPLILDIRTANAWLAVLGAIATFFLFNTVTSGRYLHRSFVKHKALFYMLLASQCLGLISVVISLVPFFNEFVSCIIVSYISRIAGLLSYSLLMTGILGLKAYRCLNNSRIVLVVLTTMRTAMVALFALDLSKFQSERRLSGSCIPTSESKILPITTIVQFAESLFICVCFVVAVWRASRSSVGKGRLSIQLSLDGKDGAESKESEGDAPQARRGWWDYVPEPAQTQDHSRTTLPKRSTSSAHDGLVHSIRSRVHGLWPGEGSLVSPPRKASFRGDYPIPPPPRTSSIIFVSGPPDRLSTRGIPRLRQDLAPPRPSSVISRLSKYMPRMLLFRRVIKDELLYTTSLTALYLLVAIPMLVGVKSKIIWGPDGWLVINWVVISLFTMHSFGRVIRRHEREAILQHPSAWDPMYRAELEASRAFRQGNTRRPFSTISTLSRRPVRRNDTQDDPFQDFRSNRSTMSSSTTSAACDTPSQYASQAWLSAQDVSVSAEMFDEISPAPTPVDRINTHMNWDSAIVFPSPVATEVPSPSSQGGFPDTPTTDSYSIVHQRITDTDNSSPSFRTSNSFPQSLDSRTN